MASHHGGKISTGVIGRLPSCNEIVPRLYLGDICVATNKQEISRLGITDMITIEIKPLSPGDLAPSVKRYLYINVMDHSKQDIMSHFETSNEFIETALKVPSNKVYVHCVAGISRSASLVIAYIMKTRLMDYYEAFEMVKEKRRVVDPNEGFVRQLTLYHKMNYSIDIANPDYRRIVLEALIFEFRLISLAFHPQNNKSQAGHSSGTSSIIGHITQQSHKLLTSKANVSILFDQYYNKLNLQQVSKFQHIYAPQTAYKCNKCRAIVFYAISVIENKIDEQLGLQRSPELTTIEKSRSKSSSYKSAFEFKTTNAREQGKECPSIFIEPQPWMSKNVLDRSGHLMCYKCKRKLGKFDWSSGESCSCPRHNSHMNFNLFKILRKKVDPPGLDQVATG